MAGTSSGLGVDFGSVIVSDDIASSGPPALYLDEKNGLGREGRSQGASVPIVSHPDLVKTGGLAACGCYQIAIADSLECFITNGLSPPPIISYMGGWATESIDRIRVEDASGEASAASNQHQNHPDRERDRDGRRTAYPSLVVRSRRDRMTTSAGISPRSSSEDPRYGPKHAGKEQQISYEPFNLPSPPMESTSEEVCRSKSIAAGEKIYARNDYPTPEATPEPISSPEAGTQEAKTNTTPEEYCVQEETDNIVESPPITAVRREGGVETPRGSTKKQSRQSTTENHTERPTKRGRHGSQCSQGSPGPGDEPSPVVKQENQGGQATSARWACPFYKSNPRKHHHCLRYDLHRIKDVRQHIDRRHRNPELYCARCFQLFSTEQVRDAHARVAKCLVRPPPLDFFEGVSEKQRRQIIQNASRGNTPAEQWYRIWDVVSPGEDRPLSPYVGNYLEETVPLLRTICDDRREHIADAMRPIIDPGGFNPSLADYLIECVLSQFEIGIRGGGQDGANMPAATSSQSSLSPYVPIAPRTTSPSPLGSGDDLVVDESAIAHLMTDPTIIGLYDDTASSWLALADPNHFNWE